MLICHKLVVSNEAAVLQACHVSDVHATAATSAVSTMPASWEVVCRWAPHPDLSITSGLSNTTTLQRCIITTTVGRRSCHTHENCLIIILYNKIIIVLFIFLFYFLLFVFGIVFNNCIIQSGVKGYMICMGSAV